MKKIILLLLLLLPFIGNAQWPNDSTSLTGYQKIPKMGAWSIKGIRGTSPFDFTGNTYWQDTSNLEIIRFVDGSILKSANPGYIDLVAQYGADTTGTTSITSLLVQAASRNKAIYLRAGKYLISSTVNLPDSTVIFGDGRLTVVQIGNNCRGIRLKNYSKVQNISFLGTKSTGGTNQTGIAIDSSSRCYISGCYFYNLAGAGIRALRTNLSGLASYNGNMIENCAGDSNTVGISFSVQAEYSCVTNCIFNNNDTGIYMEGGNNSIIGGVYNGNGFGIWINGGTNAGHSVASGVMINHNTNDAVRVTGVSLGYVFEGCMIYAAAIRVLTSDGIRFNGCDLQPSGIVITSSTNTSFKDCRNLGGTFTCDTSKVVFTTNINGAVYTQDRKKGTSMYAYIDSNSFYFNGGNLDTFNFSDIIKSQGYVSTTYNDSTLVLTKLNGETVADSNTFWISPSTKEFSLFSSPYKTSFPLGYDKYAFSIINNTAGTNRVFQYQSFGGGAIWHSRAAGGTQESPTPLLAGGQILSWGFQPWGSRFFGSVAAMIVRVRQNVSATNDTASTSITFEVTPLNAGDNARDTILLLIADTMQVEGSAVVEKNISVDSALYWKAIRPTTATTVNVFAGDRTIEVDATAGATTVNLPAAATMKGRIIVVVKTDATVNTVTVQASGAELINTANTDVISLQGVSETYRCNGTQWWKE